MVFITTSSPTNTLKHQYTYHTRRRISKTATILSHSISDIRDSQCATKCLDQISTSSISNLRDNINQEIRKRETYGSNNGWNTTRYLLEETNICIDGI